MTTPAALVAVQSRIGTIEARFSARPATDATSSSSSPAASSSLSSADASSLLSFDDVMKAIGDPSDSSSSSLGGTLGGALGSTNYAGSALAGYRADGLGATTGATGATGAAGATTSVSSTGSVPNKVVPTAAGTGNPSVTAQAADAAAGGATGNDVVRIAMQWLGTPYVFAGNTPGTALDCSGLVQQAYKRLGVNLPRIADQQCLEGQPVNSLAEAKPGDLLGFRTPIGHIAIYLGNGQMLEAPKTGEVVKVSPVRTNTLTAIRRVIPDQTSTTASSFASAATAAAGTTGTTGTTAGPWSAGSVPYASLFEAAGTKYGISPALLSAVAHTESNYQPAVVSGAGAQGLMQIMPSTAAGLGVDPFQPAQAVDGAAQLLSGWIRQFGSVDLALAAYNVGPGAVQRAGGIPDAQAQNYVNKVMSYYRAGAA